jgi:hypothetical protein
VEQLTIHFGDQYNLPVPHLPNTTKVITPKNFPTPIFLMRGFSRTKLGQVVNSFWADNGDSLSNAYTGTGAIKSDYTRTGGKRTFGGLMGDLGKSLTRIYINTFKVT